MQCKAKTQGGSPCKMPAVKGGKFCFTHNPANRAAQAAARKLGGYRSATPHAGNPESIPAEIASLADAGKLLNYVVAELIVMDNGVPRARALLQAYEMYLKSFEIGELEQRIAALEAMRK